MEVIKLKLKHLKIMVLFKTIRLKIKYRRLVKTKIYPNSITETKQIINHYKKIRLQCSAQFLKYEDMRSKAESESEIKKYDELAKLCLKHLDVYYNYYFELFR